MRKPTGFLAVVALAFAAFSLGGCATNEQKPSAQSPYDVLYTGKSDVAYATQMPVASAGEAIALGDAALAARDLDQALFQYIRALYKDGDNADVLYKIGLIHAARDNRELARLAYGWAIDSNPDHAGAHAGLGILLTRERRYDEAEAHLQLAVRLDPRLARAHNALGVLADMERNYPRAQQHYRNALALMPKSPLVLNNLGYSLYLGGNMRAAVAAFKDALTHNPNYERAWRNLALVYARQRKYDEAVEALGHVQDRAKAYNDVGYVAMVAGRLQDAESLFDEAIRLSPEYYELASENAQRLEALRTAGKAGTR